MYEVILGNISDHLVSLFGNKIDNSGKVDGYWMDTKIIDLELAITHLNFYELEHHDDEEQTNNDVPGRQL